MPEQPCALPQRKILRLPGYDYGRVGIYFATICTYDRRCLFGEVSGEEIQLNQLGKIVRDEWLRTTKVRHQVQLDIFVVMPNHIHGILAIEERSTSTAVANQPDGRMQVAPTAVGRSVIRAPAPSQALGAIVRGFKGAATGQILRIPGNSHSPVWQRNYHEHIIRDDEDLERIREYIATNPARWAQDKYHPDRS